jgi:hypothetical protein
MHPDVRSLYKQLFFIARQLEYPGYKHKLKSAFYKKKDLPATEIPTAVKHGDFVIKELEALWFLKKYRTLKRNYPTSDELEERISALEKHKLNKYI